MLWKNGGKGEIFTVLEGKNIILEKGHLGGGQKYYILRNIYPCWTPIFLAVAQYLSLSYCQYLQISFYLLQIFFYFFYIYEKVIILTEMRRNVRGKSGKISNILVSGLVQKRVGELPSTSRPDVWNRNKHIKTPRPQATRVHVICRVFLQIFL